VKVNPAPARSESGKKPLKEKKGKKFRWGEGKKALENAEGNTRKEAALRQRQEEKVHALEVKIEETKKKIKREEGKDFSTHKLGRGRGLANGKAQVAFFERERRKTLGKGSQRFLAEPLLYQ